jgi:hypothetical protein
MTDSPTLHDRLERAADDSHQPLTTDVGDLLDRARAARQRHRRTTLAAVVLTACALVGTTLGVRAALPDERGAGPGPAAPTSGPPSTDAPLTEAQVVRRCAPQLQKYAAFPMYAGPAAARLRLSHPERVYTPGDVVAVQDGRGTGNPMLCLLPEPGREQEPVPFETFQPGADDAALISEICSEIFVPDPVFDPRTNDLTPGTGPTPDLRGTDVEAVSSAGPVVVALLGRGRLTWQCSLSPVTWDAGITEVTAAGRGFANASGNGSTTGGANKSIVQETASYYYGAGTMPRDAATLEVLVQGAPPARFTVTRGSYAYAVKVPGAGGLRPSRYRVLDESGAVLYEQQEWR